MRNSITSLPILLFITFFALTQNARAQELDTSWVLGPTTVCIGQCATYIPDTLFPNCPTYGEWYLITPNGELLLVGQGGTATGITICWDQIIDYQPGVYYLFNALDCAVNFMPLEITVQEYYQPHIIPITNSPCAVDSLNTTSECQKVCSNTTVTYYTDPVSNPPGGIDSIGWSVSGAESYIEDYNTITVTWGGQGTGFISLVVDGICPGENSICVEILEDPAADFTTQPPPTAGVVSICEGQTVYFDNLSQGADAYGWFFDILGVSTQLDPEFTFQDPGTYEVTLVAQNECGCNDTTSLLVQVEAAESPLISCTGGVCAGETVTYTTAADCTTFNWSVTGSANILGGGGPADNYITIEWLDGPFGLIQLDVGGCASSYCTATLVERIPVMIPSASIEGPAEVCRDETVTYSIPEYDGSSYVWTVSLQGEIIAGQGTNVITVLWGNVITSGLTEFVQVEYDNCFLECSGMSTLPVGILNEFYISGPIVACDGASTSYLANNLYPLGGTDWDWEVQDEAGAVLWTSPAPGDGVTINWTFGPGKYRVQAVTASPDLYCQDVFSILVDVNENPGAPSGIDGPALVCPGNAYAYSVVTGQPNSIFDWTINDGGSVSNQQGNTIVITWGPTPPYELEVIQTSAGGPACSSGPVNLILQPLSSLSVTAPAESCIESTSILTADDLGTSGYTWTFTPSDAGTILSGAGTHEVEVVWHTAGPVTANVSICGESASANLTIHPFPAPDPVYPAGACIGSTVQVVTATPFSEYEWLDENGAVISTAPDPQLGPGSYELIAVNSAGCAGNTNFTIEEFPLPQVLASTPDPTGYCTGPHATLYGTATGSGYDYQWYYEGAPVGTNSSSFVDIGFGDYWVAVTDVNGCTAVSNTLEIFEYCPPGGGSSGGGTGGGGGGSIPTDCDPGTSVQFQILPPPPDCAEGSFEDNSPGIVPGSLAWDFGDGSGSSSQGPVVNHSYSQAGFYDVLLTGTSASTGDICWDSHVITIPAAADFYSETSCEGGIMQFTDYSTFVPTESIVAWSWNFGDPASGGANTSNQQSPSHTFASAGTYSVALTITAAGGCQSTITRQVEVQPLPAVAFDLPGVNCEGTPLPFVAQTPPEVISVEWDFGDPGSGSANMASSFDTYHIFSGTGSYSVTLTGTTVYGCWNSATQSLSIDPNGLSGDISTVPDPPLVCEGDPVTLTAPAGGVSWEWSDGQDQESIEVLLEDVYEVTLTDATGCQYTPDPVLIDVIPGPNGVISAVEYNEYGQPVGIFYNAYSTCEGEDVFLQVEGSPGYTYTWSNGDVGNETIFAVWRNNPLPIGVHPITVTVVDQSTGCVSIVGPFNVTVNALPDPFPIQASNFPACAGQATVISVPNPVSGLDYVWTTGETGTSIEAVLPGLYNVVAINDDGCRRDSDTPVMVEPGPYLGAIPSGCHTQCKPDTICIPDLLAVVSYQWYFNGIPVPAPNGTMANLPITQSGVYYVEMEDTLGCTATSGPLTLELYDGYGTIFGNVYMDVNENGIIDGPDTLVQGVGIELWEGGGQIGSVFSGPNGYSFANILSTDYTVQLDTSTIPAGATYYLVWQVNASLVGCDVSDTLNWLLIPYCAPSSTTLTLVGCDSSTVTYNGTPLSPGTTTDFLFTNFNGCDSTVTVIVLSASADTTVLAFEICPFETVNYLGEVLGAGDEAEFLLTNWQGCDSLVQVSVSGYPEVSWNLATDPSCWNSGTGSISLNVLGGDGPFQFSVNGGAGQAEPLFEGLDSGTYTIEIADAHDCKYEGTASVTLIPPIEMEVNVEDWDCKSGSAQVSASFLSGQGAVTWPDSSSGLFWVAEDPGIFSMQIGNDCETVTRNFEVALPDDVAESAIFLPNLFSPNGDGVNDLFRGYPGTNVEVLEYEMKIFDRWGNLLYEAADLESGWDGRYEVRDLDTGVYVWFVRATIVNCGQEMTIFKEGGITLVR